MPATGRSSWFGASPARAARTHKSLITTMGLMVAIAIVIAVLSLMLLPAVLAIVGTRIGGRRVRPPHTTDRAPGRAVGAVGGQDRENAAAWGEAALAILVPRIIRLFSFSLGRQE
jgi:uncharacterized membrane protein YdfJ with MMPL/SSD domain